MWDYVEQNNIDLYKAKFQTREKENDQGIHGKVISLTGQTKDFRKHGGM